MKAVIQQDPEDIVETPILAQAIVAMSKAMEKLLVNGLNRKAIIVLVSHDSKISQRDVIAVIDSLQNLAKVYTK